MAKRKLKTPTAKDIKAYAISMITSAADGNSPEENMYKSLLDRAVEDIGHEEHDSTQEWKDGELDCFMVAIGIEPSYAMRVLKKTELVL